MYYDKNRQIIFSFFLLCGLSAQIKDKEPRTFLFGLIKFDNQSPYEDGYWINKWFFSREFSAPINIIPIEMRYGFGVSGKTKGSAASFGVNSFKDDPGKIKYDSSDSLSIVPIRQGINNIWGTSLEIDVGLINLPYYVTGTSWLNIMTGISYRTSTILYPVQVPFEEWGQVGQNWNGQYFFSPKLNEYLISTHFQYQPFNNWYLNFRYSYGLASTFFYSPDRTEQEWNKDISGSGTSSAIALGVRFIIDPGLNNQFAIGLDLRHSYTKIHTINDPQDISPIKQFDLNNFGIYATLSAFYGGKKTIGDKAKNYYYRKDYIEALNNFNKFMAKYPSHTNRHRAEKYILDCEYKIPYKLMEQGLALEKSGERAKALGTYQYALSKVKNDTLIIRMLNGRIEQLALYWMVDAEKKLNNSEYINAYNIVKEVALFSIQGQKELRRFKSWVILGQGKELQELGFIGRAMEKYSEALELNPDLIFEVKSLQYKAGIKMANIAKKADEFEEIQLAISSLEFARELAGGIGTRNENLIIDLKEKLKSLDEYKSKGLIEKKMELGRLKLSLARSKRLEVGQSLPEVEELLGQPHEKILGDQGNDPKQQLWIYFLDQQSLQLSFYDFQLFKIEKL